MKNMTLRDLIQSKAKMLCYGVEAETSAAEKLKTEFLYDEGFIHGSVLMLDSRFPVNTAVVERLGGVRSPITLSDERGEWTITDGNITVPCPPLTQPLLTTRSLGPFGSVSD